jgi:hypothetical protein
VDAPEPEAVHSLVILPSDGAVHQALSRRFRNGIPDGAYPIYIVDGDGVTMLATGLEPVTIKWYSVIRHGDAGDRHDDWHHAGSIRSVLAAR